MASVWASQYERTVGGRVFKFFTFVTPSPCKLIGSLTKKPGARLSYFSSTQDECLFITFDQASLTLKIRDAFSCSPKAFFTFQNSMSTSKIFASPFKFPAYLLIAFECQNWVANHLGLSWDFSYRTVKCSHNMYIKYIILASSPASCARSSSLLKTHSPIQF